MVNVRYERYWNDFRRKSESKSFANLAELESWIFEQMEQDYTKDNTVMAFPTPEKAARIKEDGPWAIEFTPRFGGESIWIHQIEMCPGIAFSDGKLTAGRKHWSAEIKEWLIHCEERRRSPQFDFVD